MSPPILNARPRPDFAGKGGDWVEGRKAIGRVPLSS